VQPALPPAAASGAFVRINGRGEAFPGIFAASGRTKVPIFVHGAAGCRLAGRLRRPRAGCRACLPAQAAAAPKKSEIALGSRLCGRFLTKNSNSKELGSYFRLAPKTVATTEFFGRNAALGEPSDETTEFFDGSLRGGGLAGRCGRGWPPPRLFRSGPRRARHLPALGLAAACADGQPPQGQPPPRAGAA
jgi:hypothetical protein